MSVTNIDDVNISKLDPLIPPACLMMELPLTDGVADIVRESRQQAAAILSGKDDRLLVICGPCSIHNTEMAKEYALKLRKMAADHQNELKILMRVYFEKPRTTVGWKGLINDPDLNGSFKINEGLRKARSLLLELNQMGVPAAVEFLDTISPQFIADLVSWGAIGARTTESQVHRELASGLSMPIGFKNGTSGDLQIACDAIMAASKPHTFLSVSKQGLSAIVHTKGNPDTHIILRGGKSGTNYDAKSVAATAAALEKAKVRPRVMVDCSHGNSLKLHTNQPKVAAELCKQVSSGCSKIVGLMIESHINEGNQKLNPGVTNLNDLKYGVSVTDACINLETTQTVLSELAAAVRARRELRQSEALKSGPNA